MSNNDQLMDDILGDFLDESTELLQALNARLLQLDEFTQLPDETRPSHPCPDLLNEMFRAAHSLKGLSGMLRLDNVNGLTHRMENLLDAARNLELTITAETVDVFFKAVDRLEAMIDALRAEEEDAGDSQEVIEAIERMLAREGVLKQQASAEEIARRFAQGMAEASAPAVAETPTPSVAVEAAAVPVATLPVVDANDDPLADVRDDEDVPPKYLAIFLDESEMTLDDLSETLVASPDVSANESLLVNCHRIKGSAASIGLHRVARLAHRMEDLVQECRRQQRPVPGESVDAMLRCADAIRSFTGGLRTGIACDVLSDAYRQLLRAGAAGSELKLAPCTHCGDAHLPLARAAFPRNGQGFVGHVTFESELPLSELKAILLVDRLRQHGSFCYCQPDESEMVRLSGVSCLTFGLSTEESLDQMRRTLTVDGVAEVKLAAVINLATACETTAFAVETERTSEQTVVTSRDLTPSKPSSTESGDGANEGEARAGGKSKPAETLRVDIDRLDQLMNLAGQLVINRARFGQIGAKLKGFSAIKSTLNTVASAQRCASRLTVGMDEYFGSQSSPEMDELRMIAAQMRDDLESLQHDLGQMTHMRTALNDLSEAVHQLDRVSDGIQNTVMDTRMVPIGPLFMRFKRVVRDLTRTSNKQIELVIVGESTELDKRMIDELGDPLIHLIRNSADHGIESPEERIAAGKNPQGTITLNAFHRGNRIVIQITDDGKGLDADRILAKAISKGIVKESDAERMTPQQIYQLIWQPGFSTAEKVTEVSGRGMGMDIVQSKVEQINGAIELRSEPGQGTTFEIKLPLTMAILPSLLIVIEGDVFAIPVESVVEIVRIPNSEVGTVHGQRTARVRDRVVSVIELNDVFTWNQTFERDSAPSDDQTLVIVGVEGSELGLRVDALLGEQDVVIKSLEENFQNVGGVAGASILGDGRVSLILDVGSLLTMSQQGPRAVESEEVFAV
ncbi:MAG: hypothetical protein C0485_12060 [Pirellula sp.]|nr:hypothetical protein [Pirellula sp.]